MMIELQNLSLRMSALSGTISDPVFAFIHGDRYMRLDHRLHPLYTMARIVARALTIDCSDGPKCKACRRLICFRQKKCASLV